jgi:hypothetical protein
MVDDKTVEAINGIRSRGYQRDVKAMQNADGSYDLVTVGGGEVKASVAVDGTITYPSEVVSNG